jgi:hypothetical protein
VVPWLVDVNPCRVALVLACIAPLAAATFNPSRGVRRPASLELLGHDLGAAAHTSMRLAPWSRASTRRPPASRSPTARCSGPTGSRPRDRGSGAGTAPDISTGAASRRQPLQPGAVRPVRRGRWTPLRQSGAFADFAAPARSYAMRYDGHYVARSPGARYDVRSWFYRKDHFRGGRISSRRAAGPSCARRQGA